jgi:hypothetical protein
MASERFILLNDKARDALPGMPEKGKYILQYSISMNDATL